MLVLLSASFVFVCIELYFICLNVWLLSMLHLFLFVMTLSFYRIVEEYSLIYLFRFHPCALVSRVTSK